MKITFEKYKTQIIELLQSYHIKKAALFGSFARNEATKKSDMDLLIEAGEPLSIFDILRLEEDIENITSHKADIVEYSAIKPSIKKNILSDAIQLI